MPAGDSFVSEEPFRRSEALRTLHLPDLPAVNRTCGINRLSITEHHTGEGIRGLPPLEPYDPSEKYIAYPLPVDVFKIILHRLANNVNSFYEIFRVNFLNFASNSCNHAFPRSFCPFFRYHFNA